MIKRIHHFRDPSRSDGRAFCGAEITMRHEPVQPPANICPQCDQAWAKHKGLAK